MKMAAPEPDRVAVAWDWVLRLREEPVSREDLAAWMAWYESDDRNRLAFDQARKLWTGAARLEGRSADEPRDIVKSGTRPSASAWRARRRIASWTAGVSIAATIAAVGMFVALMQPEQSLDAGDIASASRAYPDSKRQAPQLLQETTLSDGSEVQFAVNSSVSVQFTATERVLTMKEGVAYFKVAHNKERPFVVHVGGLSVRAVGTAFNIRRATDRVVVTVTEGVVEVRPDGGVGTSYRVDAGHEIVWVTNAARPSIVDVDPLQALAWREGRLEYINEPLGSAIADIERYSGRKIRIRDESVASLVFSGTVLISGADNWVRALPELFPVEILVDGDELTIAAARRLGADEP